MQKEGIEKVGQYHYLSLPEQGITGLSEITSIRHILPQKVPIDEDTEDDYGFQPVTGIFVHESDDVWTLTFDNGDTLGVTFNHPFWSVDAGWWRLAGELKKGDAVQLVNGYSLLETNKVNEPARVTYGIEVYQHHNYLVGVSSILVHNACPKITKVLTSSSSFRRWTNSLPTQLNPRRGKRDGRFEKYATGDDTQYRLGSGQDKDKIYADGIDVDRNAAIDAKDNEGDFYTFDKYESKPFLFTGLEDEFRKYSRNYSGCFGCKQYKFN
jgi:hypothetical protein